jgi:hypothetical protein
MNVRDVRHAVRKRFPILAPRLGRGYRFTVGNVVFACRWRRTRAATRLKRYTSEFGFVVAGGPFTGLRYPHWIGGWAGDVASKLSGGYEAGIHDIVERLISQYPDHVVNVGSGEGYYAVGLAMRLPNATVIASELDPTARLLCRRLGRQNHVGARLFVRPGFRPDMVDGLGGAVAFFFDCEGAELELADPAVLPILKASTLVIELHEFVHRDILQVLTARFISTHELVLRAERRFKPAFSQLSHWPAPDVDALLAERRPEPMRWAAFFPRA